MFEHFLDNQDSWLNGKGPDSHIIMSSRMRLARNIKNFLFPAKAAPADRLKILEEVTSVCRSLEGMERPACVRMDDVDEIDRQFLLERHLISQEHEVSGRGKGFIVSSSEIISIMVNEEDHLRIQVIVSGFDLKRAWAIIDRLDDSLSKHLAFSFVPGIGYLTSCPTNVGTGLRASCMLHLPALVLTKRINKVLELLSKISFTTRGLFGEGTQALGNFFQISNQVSLGFSESEIIDNLSGVVCQVKEQELAARTLLEQRYPLMLEDNVWRSWGILSNCRLISTKEALSHLSLLCIGVDLGIIKTIDRQTLNNLFIITQPAHLQKIESKVLNDKERDSIRASIIRHRLGKA